MKAIADVILDQMGGLKHVELFTGAKITYNDDKDGVCIDVAKQSKGLCKRVKITYNHSTDLYDIEGYRLSKKEFKLFKKYDEIYCDQLTSIFEELTGYFVGKLKIDFGQGNVMTF